MRLSHPIPVPFAQQVLILVRAPRPARTGLVGPRVVTAARRQRRVNRGPVGDTADRVEPRFPDNRAIGRNDDGRRLLWDAPESQNRQYQA